MKFLLTAVTLVSFATGLDCASAWAADAVTFDEIVDPGGNFDKAEFRLWHPPDTGVLRDVLVLVPGSNYDGRTMTDDPVWQAFATKQKLRVVACHFTDKPHN